MKMYAKVRTYNAHTMQNTKVKLVLSKISPLTPWPIAELINMPLSAMDIRVVRCCGDVMSPRRLKAPMLIEVQPPKRPLIKGPGKMAATESFTNTALKI